MSVGEFCFSSVVPNRLGKACVGVLICASWKNRRMSASLLGSVLNERAVFPYIDGCRKSGDVEKPSKSSKKKSRGRGTEWSFKEEKERGDSASVSRLGMTTHGLRGEMNGWALVSFYYEVHAERSKVRGLDIKESDVPLVFFRVSRREE